jgi:hypothetical protein
MLHIRKAICRAMFNLTITIATHAKAVQNHGQRPILCFDAASIGGYSVAWSVENRVNIKKWKV